jgi:hypothetical protein
MLTIMFLTLVYSTLRNRDLKIIQATAQRWMIDGHGGISYKIIFSPKKKKDTLNVDTVWIHNKAFKPALNPLQKDDAYSGNLMSIDLTEAQPTASENVSSLPADIPAMKGDAVIVYTIGEKKRYHIIRHLQQLPFLMTS